MRTRTKEPKSGAERVRLFRERKKQRSTKAELEAEKTKTRERVKQIRLRAKKNMPKCTRTCKDPDCSLHPERDRKRVYRGRQKEPENSPNDQQLDGRQKRRIAREKRAKTEVKRLKIAVKSLTNANRRMRRKMTVLETPPNVLNEDDAATPEQSRGTTEESRSDFPAPASSILKVMSPPSRKRVFRRLSQVEEFTHVKKKLRLDGHRINLRPNLTESNQESEARSELKRKVEAFLQEDDNSMVCPDKKKVGIRYRLDFLTTLHEKFLSEHPEVDCSYAHFTRLVPSFIQKPKPTDWGTCLRKTCLNPQLMVEGLKRSFPKCFAGISLENDLLSSKDDKIEQVMGDIRNASKEKKALQEKHGKKVTATVSYLMWEKVKKTVEVGTRDSKEQMSETKEKSRSKQRPLT